MHGPAASEFDPVASLDSKDPVKVRAGHASAAKRWGPRRVISLRDLDPDQRAAIIELVEVARKYARLTAERSS
jgi:hypothetical protein